MELVERHIIKSGNKFFKEIDEKCFLSKNLYNAANYIIRQNYIWGWGYLNYRKVYDLIKYHHAYKALPAKISQQVLILLDKNWKSFFNAIASFKNSPKNFTGRPKLPEYKHKTKGRNILIYTFQAISKTALKKGLIKLSGTSIELKTSVGDKKICQVRIVPSCDCYIVEVIYHEPESTQINSSDVAGIDLGLNNLAALTSNQKGFVPLLVNGRVAKSINQFYNKRISQLRSKLNQNKRTSRRIQRLTRCRNQKINNYLHHGSRFIVNHLLQQKISTLIIGKNSALKQSINLGKRNNQNFVSIPHSRFVEMLTYKCQLVGIKVIITEESYTSVSSFLDLDPIPTYGEDNKSVEFSGKRITSRLYQAKNGKLLSADVNASYNIIRKVIPNAFSDGIGSCVVQPRRIQPLKVKMNGIAEMLSKAL